MPMEPWSEDLSDCPMKRRGWAPLALDDLRVISSGDVRQVNSIRAIAPLEI
jgi:hypothetical protein